MWNIKISSSANCGSGTLLFPVSGQPTSKHARQNQSLPATGPWLLKPQKPHQDPVHKQTTTALGLPWTVQCSFSSKASWCAFGFVCWFMCKVLVGVSRPLPLSGASSTAAKNCEGLHLIPTHLTWGFLEITAHFTKVARLAQTTNFTAEI